MRGIYLSARFMSLQKRYALQWLHMMLVFVLASCGDEAVMTLPSMEKLEGVWESQGFSKREQATFGREARPSHLVLRRHGAYSVEKFPVAEPLRMIEKSGRWELLDPSMTPSGMCSVELGGVFLSLHRRGDKFVLRYPIDVEQGFALEYVKSAK